MALQLTLSCNEDQTETGPTLVHSTGVQHYKIPAEVIRVLQDSLTNDLLSDHAEGVACQAAPERVLDILRQNGFALQNQSNDDGKAVWTVVQNGSDAEKPDSQNPTTTDDNEANGEDQGGEDEEGGDGGGGGGEEEEEEG